MDEPRTTAQAIASLKNELASQVECDDDRHSLGCDIQLLINGYEKICRAWTYLNEVNDENMKVMRDYQEENKQLNHELDTMREAID